MTNSYVALTAHNYKKCDKQDSRLNKINGLWFVVFVKSAIRNEMI